MSTKVSKRKQTKSAGSSSRDTDVVVSSSVIASDRSSEGSDSADVTSKRNRFGWCISFFKYFVAALLIPPFLNYAALLQEAAHLLPSGALYDVGFGQKLYLGCNGTGQPTVIFDAPTGMSSDVWNSIYSEVSKITKACIYDRAGLGFSERPYENRSSESEPKGKERWKPYTIERMVDDMHRLVTFSSQQPRPLLLVGSGIGSLVARFYTQVYESDVSDLLLIDPLPEDLFSYDSGIWCNFWWQQLIPSYQAMQFSAAAGISRLALLVGLINNPMTNYESVPDDVIRRQKHLLCSPRHLSTVVDEHYFVNETFSQMQTVFRMKSFPSNVSVTVVSSGSYDTQLPDSLNKAWEKAQHKFATNLHPGSKHVIVDGVGHEAIYWRRPDVIIDLIRKLVQRYRSQRTHSS